MDGGLLGFIRGRVLGFNGGMTEGGALGIVDSNVSGSVRRGEVEGRDKGNYEGEGGEGNSPAHIRPAQGGTQTLHLEPSAVFVTHLLCRMGGNNR